MSQPLVLGHMLAAEHGWGRHCMDAWRRATHILQHLHCWCGTQRGVPRGLASAGTAGAGSLRAGQFGTGQAVGPEAVPSHMGESISLASLSPALAMSQHVCLETFAKSPACWMGSTTHSLQLFSGQSKCRSGMGLVWQDMAGGSSRDSSMLQLLQAQNNQFNPRVDVEYEWWLGQDDMYESDEDLDEKVRPLHGPETLEDSSLCMSPQALLPPHWSRRSCTG